MSFTPKKIYGSGTPGQAPSSGSELVKNFNDNFESVKSDLEEKDKKIVQLEQYSSEVTNLELVTIGNGVIALDGKWDNVNVGEKWRHAIYKLPKNTSITILGGNENYQRWALLKTYNHLQGVNADFITGTSINDGYGVYQSIKCSEDALLYVNISYDSSVNAIPSVVNRQYMSANKTLLDNIEKINSLFPSTFPIFFNSNIIGQKNLYAKSLIIQGAVNNLNPGDIVQAYDGIKRYRMVLIKVDANTVYTLSGYNIQQGKTVSLFDFAFKPIDTRNSSEVYSGNSITKVGEWDSYGDITISTGDKGMFIGFNVAHTNYPDYYKTAKIQLEKGNVSTAYEKSYYGAAGYVTIDVLDDLNVDNKIIYDSSFSCRTKVDVFKKNKGSYYSNFNIIHKRLQGKNTYYVSTTGNDTNNGKTPLTPFLTVAKARDMSSSGDTIIFMEGTYISGTHFTSNQELRDRNFIGIGAVTFDANKGTPIKILGNFYAENIEFINGSKGSIWCYLEGNDLTASFNKCKFNNSINTAQSLGGFKAQGGSYYLVDCEASYNEADGFNYHKTDGSIAYIPHFTEINCKGYYNGSYPVQASYYSNNGSTTHDGSKGIRLNCEYGACRGGIIADVNPETMTYNIGCRAFSSTITETNLDFCANIFCGTSAVMYCFDIDSFASLYDVSVSGGAAVKSNIEYANIYNNGGSFDLIII